jgi:uncharacterized membrane protein
MLKHRAYLSDEEKVRISDAIRDAEKGSAGEVRVHLEARCRGDALERARALFRALSMRDTRGDTGVLLYVATASHKAAVWAGAGVYPALDPKGWQGVIDTVTDAYRRDEGPAGLVTAIAQIGELLRAHVAGADPSGNELPDEVTTS